MGAKSWMEGSERLRENAETAGRQVNLAKKRDGEATHLLPRLGVLAPEAKVLHTSLKHLPRSFLFPPTRPRFKPEFQARLYGTDHGLSCESPCREFGISELVEGEKEGKGLLEVERVGSVGEGAEEGREDGECGRGDVRVVGLD